MAYSLVINGSATYNFDVQPTHKPASSYEYNTAQVPPILTAEIETWTFEGAVYRSSTPTTDFDSLRAILRNRLTPVISVQFMSGASVIWEMTSSSHQGGIQVRSLDPKPGPGLWATYWQGDIVIVGKRLIDDGTGIVEIVSETDYSYDPAGLARQTKRGTVRTLPATSATTTAKAQTLASPGAAYALVTNGPSGVNVRTLDATDTRASFECTYQQYAVALPAGVEEYTYTVETNSTPDGDVITTQVCARGPTPTQCLAAVNAAKPKKMNVTADIRQDQARGGYTASYVQKQPNSVTVARYNDPAIVDRRVQVSIDGIGIGDTDRDSTVDPCPGADPWLTTNPKSVIEISEHVVTRRRGTWTDAIVDFQLASELSTLAGLTPQRRGTRIIPPMLEEKGAATDADLWRAERTFRFIATSVDLAAISAKLVEA